MTNPSAFTVWPYSSVLRDSHCEQVAVNIMVILKRTGDAWRPMSADEYGSQPERNGVLSARQADLFHRVAPLVATEAMARKFSPEWAKVGREAKDEAG